MKYIDIAKKLFEIRKVYYYNRLGTLLANNNLKQTMPYKYFSLIFFIGILSSGCDQKCRITCTSGISAPVAINYAFAELDSVIVNVYTANDSFNELISSAIIPDSDLVAAYNTIPAHKIPSWLDYNVSGYGSTIGDTLVYSNGPSLNLYSSTNRDVEIIVPSNNNRTYRYTKITFAHLSQYVSCHEGGTLSECNSYLASYELNGTKVNFPANTNSGLLYFSK